MIPLLDVTILLAAHRGDHPSHIGIFNYVESLRMGADVFAVPELVLSSVVRIATAPGVFKPASTIEEALQFTSDVLASPKCLPIRPSETHWRVFENLARRVDARGKLVPDAYLAALAIDQGFEFVTMDADFAKFPGLTWRHPLKGRGTTNRS